MAGLAMLFVYSFLFNIFRTCTTQDILEPSHVIRDGETLVSAGGTFELGFFSPANLSTRYLGIWYKNVTPRTVVWVANRELPLSDASGAVNFSSHGILVLLNSTNIAVWSSNVSRTAGDSMAQLLDSGNLVVRERNDGDPDNYLWQSFDYPSDTLLPGMKLGTNFFTGLELYVSSWKSTEDPAMGQSSVNIDTHGYPQLVVRKGSITQFRAGSWNRITWTGTPILQPSSSFSLDFVFNDKEAYFEVQSGPLTRISVHSSGIVQLYLWSVRLQDWVVVETDQADQCEIYALCGAYGSCTFTSSPVCSCLDGFIPKSPKEWNSSDWSGGCIGRTALGCGIQEGFLKPTGVELPDTSHSSWVNRSISLMECEGLCLNNCSCTAYANLDIRRTGCLLWYGDLKDIRTLDEGGQDLYVRLAASELAMAQKWTSEDVDIGGTKGDVDTPIFDLTTTAGATNNFSSSKKLGEGGFGPVYKGTLADGQEVKRLSKSSGQGLNEFKTEVTLIAKLQLCNLVKLLGYCINRDEKMVIYEYMSNKSSESLIFGWYLLGSEDSLDPNIFMYQLCTRPKFCRNLKDKTRSKLLDWHTLKYIIERITRGLLFLHQDSTLRIIQRDLKASNILPDGNMNPKISDFGLARIFGVDQTKANTNRVVGTYGYMPPEYVVDGLFSMKSDVFSFGVLVLEIVSGKKNWGFYHPDHDLNLLGHAWMLCTKGTPLKLIDECLADSFNPPEVRRCIHVALLCIHVALLCVQQRPENRPSTSNVVLMLGSENLLPEPKQPGFFMGRNPREADSSSSKNASYLANDITLTVLEAR